MATEIITALISSVVGGLLVAIVNHLLTRRRTEAEVEKLKAEAEKIRAETEKVRSEIGRLSTTVEEASYLATSTSERIIYDGAKGILEQDIQGRGEIQDGAIVSEGGYFQLRSYIYNGERLDYLPRNELLAGRRMRVSFEAKVTSGKYLFIVIFAEYPDGKRLETKEVTVEQAEWTKMDLYFRFSADRDSVMKFAFEPRAQGSLQLKGLVLAENPS